MSKTFLFGVLAACVEAAGARADWPTLRGDVQRTGFVRAELKAPFRLAWVRHFEGERLGTAMEPIVARDQVFVATHNGNLYALSAQTGKPVWRLHADGAFLQSPAFSEGLVVAACTDGHLYAVEAQSGRLSWTFSGDYGGFSASPMVVGDQVFIGSRAGRFVAVDLKSGRLRWRQSAGAPIRQTAAFADGRVFVTAEDLRVRCFDAASGSLVWTSEQLTGQTARDFYPVVTRMRGHTFVVVRTNPVLNMAQQIARDRNLLGRGVGIDDSGWRKLDAWTRSPQAAGNPDLWGKEQAAIVAYEREHREARTFFVLDAGTGKEALTAPVLWAAGCQGVPAPPDVLPDGRLLTVYRTAYGHWSFGVAPLVALGLLNLSDGHIAPLQFVNGVQPPWNTFWGTADESQNFVVANDLVLVVHQGTLSGFDLTTNRLFPIRGERDTFAGFRNLPWARNEWHGPARGGVAVVGQRVYWLVGSRVLCLAAGEPGTTAEDVSIAADTVPMTRGAKPLVMTRSTIQQALANTVNEVLSRRWAPLFVEPGLAGREFFFDNSGDLFEALALAYPHLPADLKRRVKTRLADEWIQHPPWTNAAWFSLTEGARRELFWVPSEVLTRLGQDKPPHPFGNLYAVWLYAKQCDEESRILRAWPQLKASFDDFLQSGWRLQNSKGDLHANRYLSSLQAFARIAEKAGDETAARSASDQAAATMDELTAWWGRAAEHETLTAFNGSTQLDPFINNGDALFFKIAPHRHKVALWHESTPGIARALRDTVPDAVASVWQTFVALCPTWPLGGEERQVHFGENFVDTPDFAVDAFQTGAGRIDASSAEVASDIDLPFCLADLDYVTKLVVALEKGH